MADQITPSESATSATGTVAQGQQGTVTTTPSETPGAETQSQTQATTTPTGTEAGATTEPNPEEQKPEQQTFNKEALLADLHKERDGRKALQAQVESLKVEVAKGTTAAEQMTAVQRRYDRLEAFAQAVGLGKALDSKSFSTALFETDEDIKTIVTKWHQENPSATSTALGSAAAATGAQQPSVNDLLRAAAK